MYVSCIPSISIPFRRSHLPVLVVLFLVVWGFLFHSFPADIHGAEVTLTWDPNGEQDLAGYKVYYGPSSGQYTGTLDAGQDTSCIVSGLEAGVTYHFAAAAYDVHGNESDLSEEVHCTAPLDDTLNHPPVAMDDAYSTDEDIPLIVASPGVLANDGDENGDTLTAMLSTSVTNGILTLNADGSFTYTPHSHFQGTDAFTYMVSDGNDGTATGTVTITVDPVAAPSETVHVGDLSIGVESYVRGKRNTFWRAEVAVFILDNSAKPVKGAVVYGHWSGACSSEVSGTTKGGGMVAFQSDPVKGGGTFTFTVDSVVKSDCQYDPEANVETSISISAGKSAKIAADGSVSMAFPNPANPSTQIRYTVMASGPVTLRIHNTLGQVIRTLVSDVQIPEVYTVRWDGRDDNGVEVASGTYLYLLRVDCRVEYGKIALVR